MRLLQKFLQKPLSSNVVTKSSGFSPIFFNQVFDDCGLSVGTKQVIEKYKVVAPLNDAVNTIANTVGDLPLVVINKETREISLEHEVLDLLRHPNNEDQPTKNDFMRDLTIWKILEGDSYVDATGDVSKPPLELFILKPQFMNIEVGKFGFAEKYTFDGTNSRTITFFKDFINNTITNIENNQSLLHIKNFQPSGSGNNITGMSEVLPLWFDVEQWEQASTHNLSLLRNGARPSGALKTDSTLTMQQRQDLKMFIDQSYQGASNSGRPLLLEQGLTWQEMSMSAKDMDFVKLKEQSKQSIFESLGVPIELKDGNSTFNNKAEAKLQFYEDTVLPTANMLLDSLNSFLLPRYEDGENIRIVVDLDKVQALSIKREARRKSIDESTSFTLNEKREEQGLEPVAGGNQVFTASGLPIAGDISFAIESDMSKEDIRNNLTKEQYRKYLKGEGETENVINTKLELVYGI